MREREKECVRERNKERLIVIERERERERESERNLDVNIYKCFPDLLKNRHDKQNYSFVQFLGTCSSFM